MEYTYGPESRMKVAPVPSKVPDTDIRLSRQVQMLEELGIRVDVLATDPPTQAARYVIAHAVLDKSPAQLEAWATDAWADALHDFVQPADAVWPHIVTALIIFTDASCLFVSQGRPRELELADGLRLIGRLDREALLLLFCSSEVAVREAALGVVAELDRSRA
jgi:hypothetical protein